jgi:DNA polymerase
MHVLDRPRILCDFETYSELDVRDVGAWAYAAHPSTEVLCLAYKIPGQKTEIWIPGQDFPQILIDHIEQGFPIEAHNCQFERAIWTEVLAPQFLVPIPKTWIDTMATCAYRSIPLSLDKAGEALNLAIQKDKRGKYLISKLCQPRKPTKKDPSTRNRDPLLLAELYEYCKTDVDAEYELSVTLGDLPKAEFGTWVMDQRINVRGVLVDVEAVYGALKIVNTITRNLEAELVTLTEGVVSTGGEVAKILKWCKDMGAYWLVNLQAGHIEDCLKDWFKYDEKGDLIYDKEDEFDNTYRIWRVLKIRQLLSRASTKKLIKFRDCRSADDRVRCLLQYHGAGTGRWAGRGVQPQNFPRGALDIAKHAKFGGNALIEALLECIRHGDADLLELHFGDPMEAIASALRGMFISAPGKKFFVADFAAIEARVLMWLAGQMDAVSVFAEFDRAEKEKPGSGIDIYCAMATKIYGYQVLKDVHKDERQQGKVVILGCGYQMGGGALQTQAAQNYGVIITLERAKELVEIFRNTYDRVPAFWKEIEWAAISAVKHKKRTEIVSENGVKLGFEYIHDAAGPWLTMILPNGRRLWYFQPGLERKTIHYEDKATGEIKSFEKDTLYYSGRSNKKGGAWTRVWSYGGMLTENAVQAIARDLMVAAMRRVEAAGYEIVLTVHDELLAEGDEGRDEKEFEALVAGPNPDWAKGCPVAAEGWKGPRYRK